MSEETCNKTMTIISQSEIEELDDFLKSLLNDIDKKVAILESQSPPRSNNPSLQDNIDNVRSSSKIPYHSFQDQTEPDVTNVVAYEQVEDADLPPAVSTLLDDISSINSGSCFSPVEPNLNSDSITVKDHLASQAMCGSIETISSIETINRPSLLDNSVNNLIENNMQPLKMLMNPYCKLSGRPFHLFSEAQLDLSTTGYMDLGTRSAAYYGEHPYSYSGITHAPCPFTDNVYLMHVLSYIKIVIPDLVFNSAMIHKYTDGNSIIPHHSDDEVCIESDSQIVTISLGETREMEFKNKSSGTTELVTLEHGEVFTMSKNSQQYFTHAIPATAMKKNARLSITLRQIKPIPTYTSEPITTNNHGTVNTQTSVVDTQQDNNGALFDPPSDTIFEPPDGYQDEQYSRYPFLESPQPSYPRPAQNHNVANSVTTNRHKSQYSWYREGWQPPPNRILPPRPPMNKPLPKIPPRRSSPERPPIQRNSANKSPHQRSFAARGPLIFPQDQMHPSRHTTQQLLPSRSNTHHSRNTEFMPFPRTNQDEVVFISSSMFSDLDSRKLSTDKIKSHVFFYRGADSNRMLQKLKGDPEVQGLNKSNVCKVFLLTGTNNVDSVCYQRQSIHESHTSISKVIDYVCSLFPSAAVNVLNILPRVQESRRNAIRQLNDHIKDFCQKSNNRLHYIDTYSTNLFTLPNGARKAELFKYTHRNDFDNVHLNNYGIIKLGRQLKYLAHL